MSNMINKFNPLDAKEFIEAAKEIKTVMFMSAEHKIKEATAVDPEKHSIVITVIENDSAVMWSENNILLKAADKNGNRFINPYWVSRSYYKLLDQLEIPKPTEAFDLDDIAEYLNENAVGKEFKLVAYHEVKKNAQTQKEEESKFTSIELDPKRFQSCLK